jgi:hypothetical protein
VEGKQWVITESEEGFCCLTPCETAFLALVYCIQLLLSTPSNIDKKDTDTQCLVRDNTNKRLHAARMCNPNALDHAGYAKTEPWSIDL